MTRIHDHEPAPNSVTRLKKRVQLATCVICGREIVRTNSRSKAGTWQLGSAAPKRPKPPPVPSYTGRVGSYLGHVLVRPPVRKRKR